jgi:DNA-binding NarL/FixJ family response regulator
MSIAQQPESKKRTVQVLFHTADLMFSSRVLGAASALGLGLKIVPTAAAAADAAGESTQLVLIDLTQPGIEITSAVENIRDRAPAAKIIAFGPHVDEDLLSRAATAGCDAVLTRSQFNQRYAAILKSCLA